MIKKFKNLRIRTKLLYGFSVTACLMILIGTMSVIGMNRLSANTEFIYKTNLLPVTILSDLRAAMLKRSNHVVWHLLATDSATMAAREKSIAELDKQVDELLEQYAPVIVSESERKFFDQLQAGVPAYLEARGKVLQLSRNFSKDAAAELQKTELVQKLSVLFEAVEGLIGENKTQAQESYESGRSLSSNLNWGMSFLSLVALLAGGFTLWFVSKLILENLENVLEATKQLRSGNLGFRSTVDTSEEIGQLAQAFNTMGEQIAHMVENQRHEIEAKTAEVSGLTDAISKSQAIIELSLDGTVLTANDNFQQCLGYRLDEITKQNHRMFCTPAHANSTEYHALWAKLNRGEFYSGVHPRLRKDGKEIWVQASYNPIHDFHGKVYKIVEFATDITEQRLRAAEFESRIHAANRGQAVIEFSLDGTILTANDNFLQCVGYRLDEIKGQHHRMFYDAAYVSSADYAAFWQTLNRGDFVAGTYRLLGKGGKIIWNQASYNPITDIHGKVYKVVEYATDVTEQKQVQSEMERLVQESQTVLGKLAANDLTQQMTGTYQGDLEKIKTSINAVVQNLTETIVSVRESVEAVTTGAQEITKSNEDLSQRTSEQASALEETSASMEEMTSTVKQNADNAKQANQLAIAARNTADKGGAVTKKAVEAMGEINKSSKKIADIITVIDEIAFQTNLLALNAAVEAARAGEHGRGFAVVAAEVRNLAQRSATAAKEIKDLIKESIQRVNDGTELVNHSGKTLEDIVKSVKHVTDIIEEITTASQEQASGIDQVNKAIMAMDETTQQNAALVEKTTSASQHMMSLASELLGRMEVFRTTVSESEKAGMTSVASLREHVARSIGKAYQEQGPQHEVSLPSVSGANASTTVRLVSVRKGRSGVEKGFEEF